MYGHPGKKLLFMGCEIGQWDEWNHDVSVQWDLLQFDNHRKLQNMVRDLNHLYRAQAALYEVDFDYRGFEWIDFHDYEHSVISFIRRAADGRNFIIFCCNFTPVPRTAYRIGVPQPGIYREVFNTDSELYGGSNMGNGGQVKAEATQEHGRPHSIRVTLPPLGVVMFQPPR